jgi:hypothetical protein
MMTPMWIFFLLAITKYNEAQGERRKAGGGSIDDVVRFYVKGLETGERSRWARPVAPASS